MAVKAIENVNVSISPHIRKPISTRRIMLDVCIAITPACIAGIIAFGWRAAVILLISVLSCVATEAVFELITKKPLTIGDFSAVVTGLILGCNLPSTIPFWMPALGGVFAILIVKMIFGGLGQNFMNPALAARCFLLISFAGLMTRFPETIHTLFGADPVTTATPLAVLRDGGTVNIREMLLDLHNGCIGEASAICVLIGFVYLLVRRVITPLIPCVYIGSTVVFVVLLQLVTGHAADLNLTFVIVQMCGGGLLLGACFMANDYVTSPLSRTGQLIYGLVLGLLTSLFRILGSSSEGVSYAIIIGNCVVPLIDRVTIPRPFGREKEKKIRKEGQA